MLRRHPPSCGDRRDVPVPPLRKGGLAKPGWPPSETAPPRERPGRSPDASTDSTGRTASPLSNADFRRDGQDRLPAYTSGVRTVRADSFVAVSRRPRLDGERKSSKPAESELDYSP
ncbi:hypothetical protein ACJJTC_017339 [Scirpophaga incertulas]